MSKRAILHAPRLIGLLLCLLLTASLAAGQEATDTPDATAEATANPAPAVVGQYERLTLYADVDPDLYTNPFDPADIEVVAIFDAPSGRQVVIPGFWMQPYTDQCSGSCNQESLQMDGSPEWQVRFAPDEPGPWSYTVQVRDNGTLLHSTPGQVDVTPAERTGFVNVAANRRYFVLPNQQPYFPIGHNLSWSWQGTGGWHAYERWFESLAASGGNYARLIVDVPWFVGLEWEVAGNYSAAQNEAYRLDRIIELAAEHGIRLQLVLLWSQSLRTTSGPPVLIPEEPARPDTSADWDNNPYNSANGGVLNAMSQFFTSETAENLFRRRLRYIAARWGYSPDIFAWELTDELDMISSNGDVTIPWVQDMVSYLRQIDQDRHLITVGSRSIDDRLTQTALLDFTQGRLYQSLPIESTFEQETGVVDTVRRALRLNNAPTLLTAYSLNPWYEPTESDPTGVHFQNTLWAAFMAGAGGGAVSEWGPTYVLPQQLQRYYAPLAAFTSGVDWAGLNLQPAEAALIGDEATVYGSVRVSGFERQFRTPPSGAVVRTIAGDGVYPPITGLTGYLYGQVYNTQFAQPQTYRVTVPVDTYLEVGVRLVSDQALARLSVTVDSGAPVEMELAPSTRGAALRVPLAAGEHVVTLDNRGDDWLELDYLEVDQIGAPARVLTLRDPAAGVALSWLQHRDYTWDKVAAGEVPEPLTFTYQLDEMPPGRYLAELWNPLTGAVLGEELLRVGEDGILRFELLPLSQQLAVRVFRQPDAPAPTPLPTEHPTATQPPAPTATLEATLETTAAPEATAERTAEGTATPETTPEPTAAVTETLEATATMTRVPLEPQDSPLVLPDVDSADFQSLLDQLPAADAEVTPEVDATAEATAAPR